MKSLKERLEYQKDEVLAFVETFGRFKAMQKFRISDYSCFRRWLKEVTGDENFGINPKITLNSDQTLGDQLVYAFLRKVASLEAQNEALSQRLAILELQLSPAQETEDHQAMAILQVCRA